MKTFFCCPLIKDGKSMLSANLMSNLDCFRYVSQRFLHFPESPGRHKRISLAQYHGPFLLLFDSRISSAEPPIQIGAHIDRIAQDILTRAFPENMWA